MVYGVTPFLTEHGAVKQEILSLNWSNIDFEFKVIYVRKDILRPKLLVEIR